MTLITGNEALEAVQDAARDYVEAQTLVEARHNDLKEAIKTAAGEANQTQEKIAAATSIDRGEGDGSEFRLSRQRISQIIHE